MASASSSLTVGSTLSDTELQKTLDFKDQYELTQKLRSGSYGTVYVTRHKASGDNYAVKMIDRKKLKPKDDVAVFREVSVLQELKSVEGVIQLMDFFVQKDTFYVVQQYARGGDLFDRLASRKTYSEVLARDVASRLLKTIADMHAKHYVHRDMKTENLLLRDEIDDCHVLVADFGFAKHCEEGTFLKTRCGTPAFVAPEVLLGTPYNESVDMWGVGVILYLLLGGYPPFRDENHKGLFRKIRAGDYTFHEAYWGNVSVEAKQLISSLLTVDPGYRWTAKEAMESPWLQMKEETLSEHDLSSSLGELKSFTARRRLKSAASAVRWAVSARFWNPDHVTFAKQLGDLDSAPSEAIQPQEEPVQTGAVEPPKKTSKPKVICFRDSYELTKKIRSGSFSTVWECTHLATGDEYAVKVIKREGLKPSEDEAVLNEVAVVQSLEYKHIVQLVDFYEETDYFYLVMEYMKGGDVFDRIVKKTRYTELDARDLIRILLKSCKFMHEHGVAHRDLKPQNLLLQSLDDDAQIKVGDFGFARRVHTPRSLTTRCGTPTYVSPEILKNIPHDQQTDMWSAGVILYVCLVGYPPFMEDNQQELFRKIRAGEYVFIEEDWKHISEDAMNLIRGLLVVDPSKRLTAEEALRNRWICEDDSSLSSRDLTESLVKLKERKHRLRGIARAVMFFGRGSMVKATTVGERPSTIAEDDSDKESSENFKSVV